MAVNPYVNKVVYGDTTLIDITDTTATASDVAAGKYFYDASGAKVEGTSAGGGGMTVIEEEDPHGGTVITISGDTVYLQSKSATPTESTQTIVPDTGYTAMTRVEVGAISSTYVGSEIDRNDSTDLEVSGATIVVPAGYYEDHASASVASGSAITPTTTITANPTIGVSSSGLITAEINASQNITPTVDPGYVSSGTAGTVSVSGSNTSQLTTQAAQTIHPSTSDQTINYGRYLTGAQTIKGVTVSNLAASNIKSGVTVKIGDSTDDDCVTSVTGTLEFQTIYSGTSAPTSSIGSNGDVYIQTSS